MLPCTPRCVVRPVVDAPFARRRSRCRAGYTVVVPNRTRTLPAPDGTLVTGLFADVQAITESIEALVAEDALAQSPLYRIVDTTDIATVGHSFGGGAVIDAAAGVCTFPFCSEAFLTLTLNTSAIEKD